MKFTFTFLSVLFASTLFAQTFCLRLSEVSNDGSNFILKIEMAGSNAFDLGSSNLQWSYNTTKLINPVLESSSLPGIPFYEVNVTTPNPGEASLNIELSFADNGATIATGWTEIAQVNYTVLDPSGVGELLWLYNGGTTETVVYIDNETTQIFATAPACLENLLAPLPVELMTFKAQKKGTQVQLDWETASEINTRGFDIERSADALQWEKIGWQASNGQSVSTLQYRHLDTKPLEGANYYRLKIWDYDDRFDYSALAQVQFEKAIAVELFPNPAKGLVNLNYPEQEQLERVVVYDQVGSQRYETAVAADRSLDLSALAGGVYFVELRFAQQVVRKKLILNP